ncbi:MAG: hypothetical protein LBK25_08370 [Treponema sp.]|jgi:hypothetical protein|nr:hypothetical protein [Treponema sp.]
MTYRTEWYPNSRTDQINLIKIWNAIFADKGQAWNIPTERIAKLVTIAQLAETILSTVNSGQCTSSDVVKCNEIFKEMEIEARFIKKHYLLSPPLAMSDFPNLLLSLPNDKRTPIAAPVGQPALTVTYPGGPHVLTVRFASLPGTEPPDSRGDYGFALYRGIMPQGGATVEQATSDRHYLMKEPLSGKELLHYRFVRRKKEIISFEPEEAGMTVYFCARYENQKGESGAWGPVVSAIIP